MDRMYSRTWMRGISLGGLLSASLLSITSQAGIIEHREYSGDAQGLIFVQDTNQEWLNLQFTDGQSQSWAETTYTPEGFRVAEMADLTNLFNALGIAEKHEANCTKFNDVPVNNQFRCSHNKINKTLAGESKYSQPLFNWFSVTHEVGATIDYIFASYMRDDDCGHSGALYPGDAE